MPRPPATILFSARAKRELDEVRAWWAKHHPGTRVLDDALARALHLLEVFPEMGPRAQIRGQWSTTRRIIIDPVGYHLYYRFDPQARTILVRALWHERRRRPRFP